MIKQHVPTPVHRVAKLILRQGLRFGQLETLARVPSSGAGQHDKWRCKCDCGVETTVRSSYLVSGKTTSCGCARKKKKETRGGKREGAGRPESGSDKVQISLYLSAAAVSAADALQASAGLGSRSEAFERAMLAHRE